MIFELKNKKETKEKRVMLDAFLDSDGDLNISVDGINVFYLHAKTGTIHRYSITSMDADELETHGFKLIKRGRDPVVAVVYGDEML